MPQRKQDALKVWGSWIWYSYHWVFLSSSHPVSTKYHSGIWAEVIDQDCSGSSYFILRGGGSQVTIEKNVGLRSGKYDLSQGAVSLWANYVLSQGLSVPSGANGLQFFYSKCIEQLLSSSHCSWSKSREPRQTQSCPHGVQSLMGGTVRQWYSVKRYTWIAHTMRSNRKI